MNRGRPRINDPEEIKRREEELAYWSRVVWEALKFGRVTIQDLAERLGVSPRDVAFWRAGQRRPTGFVAVRLYEYRCVVMSGTTVHCEQTGRLAV